MLLEPFGLENIPNGQKVRSKTSRLQWVLWSSQPHALLDQGYERKSEEWKGKSNAYFCQGLLLLKTGLSEALIGDSDENSKRFIWVWKISKIF